MNLLCILFALNSFLVGASNSSLEEIPVELNNTSNFSKSCNFTTLEELSIRDCPTSVLNAEDYSFLNNDTLYVKSLNLALQNSSFDVTNGSVAICDCLLERQKMPDIYENRTCNFILDESTPMPNCSSQTLKPENYIFLSNRTLHIPALNLSLNGSFYDVANGTVSICTPSCESDEPEHHADFTWTVFCVVLFVLIFEAHLTCYYYSNTLTAMIGYKFSVLSSMYFMSSTTIMMWHFAFPYGVFTGYIVFIFYMQFFAVTHFGILTLESSDYIIRFLHQRKIVKIFRRVTVIKDKRKYACLRYFCTVLPFLLAFLISAYESPSIGMALCDMRYSKAFKYIVPLPYFYDVILIIVATSLSVYVITLVCYWTRVGELSAGRLVLMYKYRMFTTLFLFMGVIWITGHSILASNHPRLWSSFLPVNVILSFLYLKLSLLKEDAVEVFYSFFPLY